MGKKTKGITLPINMLVILSVAVVVLLALVAFFMSAFGSTSGTMSRQARKDACCQSYVFQGGCNGNTANLEQECQDVINNENVGDCCKGMYNNPGSVTFSSGASFDSEQAEEDTSFPGTPE